MGQHHQLLHQPLPHQHPQIPPQPHLTMVVDPLAGPMMYGVMMKTTMPIATGTVELVASMITKDMRVIAQIVSVLSVNHLDGMVITTVMTVSILEVVNTMEEIAAVIACLLPTAMLANVLILKPKPGQRLTSTNLKNKLSVLILVLAKNKEIKFASS